MTMFRRVFSNHFVGPEGATDTVQNHGIEPDVAPAPSSAPPMFIPHSKSDMTELSQSFVTARTTEPAPVEAAPVAPAPVEYRPADPAPFAPVIEQPHVNLEPQERAADVAQAMPADAADQMAQRAAQIHAQILSSTPRLAAETMPQATQGSGAEAVLVLDASSSPDPVSRRARTRLLGFDAHADGGTDPIHAARSAGVPSAQIRPVGWVVVTQGAGVGHHFALFGGVAMVGRGDDQAIRLDFGDQAISRQNHAAIAYDPEDNKFYVGHGGKSNIIKLNGRPVLSTEEMAHGDTLRIGETTLMFVALCGAGFQWNGGQHA